MIALVLTTFGLAVLPAMAQTGPPSLPTLHDVYQLGLPGGNIRLPRRLAWDNQTGQLYVLNEGSPETHTGLSVYNPATGQFTGRLRLSSGYHQVFDLQLDATTGYLYALWASPSSPDQTTLTVIERDSLQVVQEISNPLTMATGGGRLYTADLTGVERYLTGQKFSSDRTVALASDSVGPLALDLANDRLYLARALEGIWRIEILEAESLKPLGDYPLGADNPVFAQVLDILPRNEEILVVAATGNANMLYRMTPAGEPVGRPIELGPRYDPAGVALAGNTLYFSNGHFATDDPAFANEPGPALGRLDLADLSPQSELHLPANVEALAINPAAAQAYGLVPYDNRLYVIDLANETVEIISTAVTLKDLLVDEAANRLYLSDSSNRVRLLAADTLTVLAETTLTGNPADFGFNRADFSGELALDPQRERLYVSGLPAVVLHSATLAEIEIIEPGGQIEPDPAEDLLYLTHCGVTLLQADTLRRGALLPGSAPRPDNPLPPNPCVIRSELDAANRRLLSTAFNGISGSNGGNLLYIYDLTVRPTLIYSGADLSLANVEPAGPDQVLANHVENSQRRLRLLDLSSPAPRFSKQLLGLSGEVLYDPASRRFYLSEGDQPRLLTLEGATLEVLGETRLPPGRNYRLADLDSPRGRLYLIGAGGELLIASTTAAAAKLKLEPAQGEEHLPDGPVLRLTDTSNSLIAQIQSATGEHSSAARLYRSDDGGQSWRDLSANLPPLPVRAVAVSPHFDEDQTLLAGLLQPGQSGGLYRSTDGGLSWSASMAGLRDLWVEELFVSPNFSEDELLFARTTYGGLHYSNDGGQTWTALTVLDPNGLFPTATTAQAAAFSRNGVVLASQEVEQPVSDSLASTRSETNGLLLSTLTADGRLSEWLRVLDVPAGLLALSPDGEVGLAFSATGLWHSSDGGLSWNAVGAGLTGIDALKPGGLTFSPDFATDQVIYSFFRDEFGLAPGLLFRSSDAGQTWQPWQPPAQAENITALTLALNGDLLLGHDQGQVSRLPLSRLKWADEAKTEAVPPAEAVLEVAIGPDTSGPTVLALSSRQGLFVSTDGGEQWSRTAFPARGYGYALGRYRLSLSPHFADDQTVFVATGRSLHRSVDGGLSWTQLELDLGRRSQQLLSFPAQRVALSPDFAQDSTLLVNTSLGVYRSTDGGESWQQTLSFEIETSHADVLLYGPDGQTAYTRAGYAQSLFKSKDGGQSWQEQRSKADYFSVIASAVDDQGTLTVAPEFEARLLQTDLETPGWREIKGPAELVDITGVVTTNDSALIVAGSGGLFRSNDGGRGWQAPDPSSPFVGATVTGLFGQEPYLVATLADGSIFLSPDRGESWQDISVFDRN
jgi:photosystem II stability/assembly factor-like uncharacterized protein/DNA-binding beta-propeller fold protein YncE